jgi:hypothetical protein
MRIRFRDPESFGDPGSGMEKFGSVIRDFVIRDKHPGSATLKIFIILGGYRYTYRTSVLAV